VPVDHDLLMPIANNEGKYHVSRQQPQNSVMVEVPDDCRMHGMYGSDGHLLFTLGWPKDHALVQFAPAALEQFIQLATQLQATPHDPTSNEPVSALTPMGTTQRA
jgi:hypothetical protein